jgi:hypothetical protein
MLYNGEEGQAERQMRASLSLATLLDKFSSPGLITASHLSPRHHSLFAEHGHASFPLAGDCIGVQRRLEGFPPLECLDS